MRRFLSITLAVLSAVFCSSALAEDTMGLDAIKKAFRHTNAVGNQVCILHDGWQIAFLSHNKDEVGAVFITEAKDADEHENDLSDTATRVASLISMGSPQIMELEDSDTEAAILIDSDVMDALGEEVENVLDGSPLAGMAYLLADGYFYIHDLRPNGYLHWKTVKKSGVELLMPMAPAKLSAVEITGSQQMNDFAAEVLARKLGFGSNTVHGSGRDNLSMQMRWNEIPYMNSKSNVLLGVLNRRAVIGKRQYVAHMLANRYGGTLVYPSRPSDWPEEEQEEEVAEEQKPLTPAEAREAYIKYLQGISS